jgi:hypothetical protein
MAKLNTQMAKMIDPRMLQQMGGHGVLGFFLVFFFFFLMDCSPHTHAGCQVAWAGCRTS